MHKLTKKLSLFFLDIAELFVLAASFFVIAYLFFFQPHQVYGHSMDPSFEDQQLLLTDKISYRLGIPKRGDVVVFKAPAGEPCAARECEYIKRIIGLPGEEVKIENGGVLINGQKLNEVYLPNEVATTGGSFLATGETVELNQDEYFLLGDNRVYSRDGRDFGPIKRNDFIGKAWFSYWPPSRIGLLGRGRYK